VVGAAGRVRGVLRRVAKEPRVTVIVVNGHPRSSNPRSYTDVCTPHSFETCPVHGQRVRFNALGELEGRCWKCSEEAAQGIRHIEETIA
jgi:hypothetical protein